MRIRFPPEYVPEDMWGSNRERKYYLPEALGRNLTPSPSATAMTCALAVLAQITIDLVSNRNGRFESPEGIGGSTIS